MPDTNPQLPHWVRRAKAEPIPVPTEPPSVREVIDRMRLTPGPHTREKKVERAITLLEHLRYQLAVSRNSGLFPEDQYRLARDLQLLHPWLLEVAAAALKLQDPRLDEVLDRLPRP